jgi:PAS domain S-box-containing protein
MQMEMALRDSEESYRTVMDMSPDTITINRIEDGRYVEVNRAFCDLTGYRSEEVAGRTPTEVNLFVAPNDRKRLAAALRHGVVRGLEMRFRDKSGTISDSLVSARPIQFKGNPCYLFIVTLITPLKMVQQALAESEESYRTILESAPYAIVITRISDAQFRQVNSAFCRQTGFSRAETIGRTTFDLEKLIDSSDRKRMLEILHRDGQVNGLEVCFKAKDGGLLETLFSAAPIRYKGDDCILSMTVDIGARKLAERELDQYRQHLEEMVQSRTVELKAAQQELIKGEKLSVLGQLTATVSHELRNPLGVIRSSNFYLQRHMGDKDDKVPKHFKRIDEQVTLCDAIVSELLEYTRGRNVSRVRDDIRPLLKQVIEQSCEDNTIPIGLEQSGDFSTVPHDPEKMRRVFINVIDNAIQAIKAQQRLAKEAARRYDPAISIQATMQSDHVIIAILDNGVGMNAETLEKAFEPLFTTRARGTGIGLANVKKIISEHGGEVSLESRLGEGTRMTIRLPCT